MSRPAHVVRARACGGRREEAGRRDDGGSTRPWNLLSSKEWLGDCWVIKQEGRGGGGETGGRSDDRRCSRLASPASSAVRRFARVAARGGHAGYHVQPPAELFSAAVAPAFAAPPTPGSSPRRRAPATLVATTPAPRTVSLASPRLASLHPARLAPTLHNWHGRIIKQSQWGVHTAKCVAECVRAPSNHPAAVRQLYSAKEPQIATAGGHARARRGHAEETYRLVTGSRCRSRWI